MKQYQVLKVREHGERKDQVAQWFHEKWGIPQAIYVQSIQACLENTEAVPQWYVVLDGQSIIAGLGVIENDFHNRKDITPNVCGVYVEEPYRKQGIARQMLDLVCEDCAQMGISTLYLLTDHTSLYERYGWEFFCFAQGDGESHMSRMYIHKM